MASAKLSPARKAALSVLDEARKRDGYARDVADSSHAIRALDLRDAGLARHLVLGVTAAEGCLDELLDRFLAKPNKVAPRVRIALRIAAFELLYRDVPAEIAVSQGVELVRFAARNAASLGNAVLRKVAAARDDYLAALDTDESFREVVRHARMAGLPVWLTGEIADSIGVAGIDSLAASELDPAPNAVHINARQGLNSADSNNATDSNAPNTEGASYPLPGCIAPADVRPYIASGAFDRAEVVASDAHAQLIATAATRPGSCLEIGAGRGTKTYIMASQAVRAGFERNHVALDLYEAKCRQNLERLERAGVQHVKAIAGDACDLDIALAALDGEGKGEYHITGERSPAGKRRLFDTVFVDAPCSGTGTIRRHSEIPWRLQPNDIDRDLPALQLAMLCQAATRVASGGELFYATCSVLRQENERVVTAFLASEQGAAFACVPVSEAMIFSHPDFAPAAALLRNGENERGMFQSIPAPNAFDGHFCARFIRR